MYNFLGTQWLDYSAGDIFVGRPKMIRSGQFEVVNYSRDWMALL
jgi:hypothetical protein